MTSWRGSPVICVIVKRAFSFENFIAALRGMLWTVLTAAFIVMIAFEVLLHFSFSPALPPIVVAVVLNLVIHLYLWSYGYTKADCVNRPLSLLYLSLLWMGAFHCHLRWRGDDLMDKDTLSASRMDTWVWAVVTLMSLFGHAWKIRSTPSPLLWGIEDDTWSWVGALFITWMYTPYEESTRSISFVSVLLGGTVSRLIKWRGLQRKRWHLAHECRRRHDLFTVDGVDATHLLFDQLQFDLSSTIGRGDLFDGLHLVTETVSKTAYVPHTVSTSLSPREWIYDSGRPIVTETLECLEDVVSLLPSVLIDLIVAYTVVSSPWSLEDDDCTEVVSGRRLVIVPNAWCGHLLDDCDLRVPSYTTAMYLCLRGGDGLLPTFRTLLPTPIRMAESGDRPPRLNSNLAWLRRLMCRSVVYYSYPHPKLDEHPASTLSSSTVSDKERLLQWDGFYVKNGVWRSHSLSPKS